jgi:hypothetical protein
VNLRPGVQVYQMSATLEPGDEDKKPGPPAGEDEGTMERHASYPLRQ